MIVQFIHTLPGENRTSSEVYARLLSDALEGLNEPGLVIRHKRAGSRLRNALAGSRPASRLGGWADRYVAYQANCLRRAADVNHIPDHGYAHLAFSLGPRRCVVSFHDALLLKLHAGEIPGMKIRPRVTISAHRLSLAALKRCAHILVPSQQTKDDLLRFVRCDPSRVTMTPLAPAEQFRVKTPSRKEHIDESVRILSIGHTGASKNIETILRVFARVVSELGPKVTLVRVGPPFTAAQRLFANGLNIEGQIEFLGEPDFADLPAIYTSCDVLLMPSHYEGFGLPVVEAMASGVPVVTSNAGSLPEVVDGAGFMADPLDITAFAGEIIRIASDSDHRNAMAERGIARAKDYTWEATARATLNVYRKVQT
jgi:glycosyltransferase involved in cell wall biosynthesis